jgi:FtsH-binding integral membrane protein
MSAERVEPKGESVAELKDKIQNALDEGRMLVLGSQVLLGFQYRSVFEPGFEKLSLSSQYLKVGALGLMLLALGLLLTPGAYHRIVAKGEDTHALHRFTTRVMDYALLPFAVALGLDIYVACSRTLALSVGLTIGAGATFLALFFWYGLEFKRRGEREPQVREEQQKMSKEKEEGASGAKTKDKIRHVLTECRVVLPGAQALLGFQFVTTLMEAFEKLPASSKYVHLASLLLVAVSIVLLMTPAAYHRIVERGEETEHFHRFAGRILIAAMVPLALGVSGDLFVVVRKVTESATSAAISAIVSLLFFYGLWFGFTLYRRSREPVPQKPVENNGRQFAS